MKLLEKEAENIGCKVIHNADLKKYNTFRIGGKAAMLIELASLEACEKLIPLAEKENISYYIFGKGSNLIVDDNGINGVIFHISSDEIKLLDETRVYCAAGVPLSKLCMFALENGLSGLEFAYGIPGSVGGAVYMNAGAYGGEVKDVIESAEAIDTNGNSKRYSVDELEMSYRKSVFSGGKNVIVSAVFKLAKGEKSEIKAKMDELMQKRRSKQPIEYPSAGSTFKRPEGSYASLLIEQCGLKGYSVGDAQVSEKHSGFVVNKGNASFDDLMKLICDVKKVVYDKTGYRLECEPEIISDREEYRR